MNEHWTSLEQKLAGTEPDWQVLVPQTLVPNPRPTLTPRHLCLDVFHFGLQTFSAAVLAHVCSSALIALTAVHSHRKLRLRCVTGDRGHLLRGGMRRRG